MSQFFMKTCKENSIPSENKMLFKDISLAKFLVGKVYLHTDIVYYYQYCL